MSLSDNKTIVQYLRDNPFSSFKQVSEGTGLSINVVVNSIHQLYSFGVVTKDKQGRRNVYSCTVVKEPSPQEVSLSEIVTELERVQRLKRQIEKELIELKEREEKLINQREKWTKFIEKV